MERKIREIARQGAIILFDGYCNLCSGSVQFIIKRDPGAYFHFASLQSAEAKVLGKSLDVDFDKFDSIILIEKGEVYYQSTAALRIARKLKFPWMLFYAFIILPRLFRDPIYGWVARNRYKWFGRKDACMVPTAELRGRFL